MKIIIGLIFLCSCSELALHCQSAPAVAAARSSSGPGNSAKIDRIRTLVQNFRLLNRIPGLGVAIVHNNRTTADGGGNVEDLVLAEGFGFRDRAAALEANNQTLFSIGSNTKGFSASLIVKILHEQFPELGEAVLDTPLRKLAPGFDLLMLSDRFRTEALTFRDIFSMRVCLSNNEFNEMFAVSPTKHDFYYRFRYFNESCTFRNGFAYSNGLYGLAGEIAAHIANSTVEEIVLDFMAELEMRDSTFFDMEGKYESLPNISKGYYKRLGIIREFDNRMLRRVAPVTTAGAILATPADWVKYMNFQLNGGRVNGRQVVPEEVLSWLFINSNALGETVGRKSPSDPVTGAYGYGFAYVLGVEDGYRMISHGGYYPPFNSHFSFYPDLGIGIFTVSNGPGITGIETGLTHTSTHSRILQILLESDDQPGSELTVFSSKEPPPSRSKVIDSIDMFGAMNLNRLTLEVSQLQSATITEFLDDEQLVGVFGNANSGDLHLEKTDSGSSGSSLVLRYGEWGHGTLTRVNSSATFSIQWTTNFLHQFYTFGELFNPKFYLYFSSEDQVDCIFTNGFGGIISEVRYVRNATIETFPEIPWAADSCSPTDTDS